MARSRAGALGGVLLCVCLLGACRGTGSNSADGAVAPSDRGPFSALMAKRATARYRVRYRRVAPGARVTAIVIAQDPPRYFLDTGRSRVYVPKRGELVRCDGEGSSPSCSTLPSATQVIEQALILEPILSQTGALFVNSAPAGIPGLAKITPVDRAIAGRTARCVTLDRATLRAVNPSATGLFVACIDAQTGVLLELRVQPATGAGAFDLVATTFGLPRATDFVPPAGAGATPTS